MQLENKIQTFIFTARSDTLFIGNLEARRDWGYAEEYVEGMWSMLQASTPDDFVLATGVCTSVKTFVEYSAQSLGISIEWRGTGVDEVGYNKKNGKPVVVVDPKFYRPAEVDVLLGDASKAEAKLGWKPTINVEQLCHMMVTHDYDLAKKSV